MPTTRHVNWAECLSWFVTYLYEPVELTVTGAGGLILDGPATVARFTDCLPGVIPTHLWIDLHHGPPGETLRLWINVRNIEDADVDDGDDSLTLRFEDGTTYKLRPR